MDLTGAEWPLRILQCAEALLFQILMVVSLEQLAMILLDGLMETS
jgi:hypothetical protein